MGSMEYGAKQAIENCLRVKEGEKLIVITDYESLDIATMLKNVAQKRTKTVELYILDHCFETQKDHALFLKSSKSILSALKDKDVSIYCSSPNNYKKTEESVKFIDDLFQTVQKNKIRHAHMPCITKEIMETGMCADYSEIQRISRKLCNIIKNAQEIEFTTQKGTYITTKFSQDTRWFLHDGSFEDDIPIENLPTGNLSAPPNSVEGILVIDGYIGSHLNKKYGNIESMPITLKIEKNRVVKDSVKCDNDQLRNEFSDLIFETDKNTSRIGGVIIGTNIGLEKVIKNLLQDEKLPGLHVLFGSPSYFPLNKWSSKVICDSWIKNTTLVIDRKKVIDKGVFLV